MLLDGVRRELNERIDQIRKEETKEGHLPLRHRLRIEELRYALRLIDKAMIENYDLAIGQWYYVVKKYNDRLPKVIKARLVYKKSANVKNIFYFTENENKKIIHLNKEDMFTIMCRKDTKIIPFFLDEDMAIEYRNTLIDEMKKKEKNDSKRKQRKKK